MVSHPELGSDPPIGSDRESRLDTLTTVGLLSLSLVDHRLFSLSRSSLSPIIVFSLYLSPANAVSSLVINDIIPVRPTLFLTVIVHVIPIGNGIGARYTILKGPILFSTIFFIHAIVSLLNCLWQILDCLWNVCVFTEFFFYIDFRVQLPRKCLETLLQRSY